MALFNPNPMAGLPTYRKYTGLKTIFFIVSLVVGAYLVNYPFGFVKIPESILRFDKWIFFAAGILVLVGIINFFRANKIY